VWFADDEKIEQAEVLRVVVLEPGHRSFWWQSLERVSAGHAEPLSEVRQRTAPSIVSPRVFRERKRLVIIDHPWHAMMVLIPAVIEENTIVRYRVRALLRWQRHGQAQREEKEDYEKIPHHGRAR